MGARQRVLVLIACLTVPLSAVTNVLVKKPFDELVGSVFDTAPRLSPDTPAQFAIAVLVFGAFAEEVAKTLPFLIPRLRSIAGDPGMAGFAAGIGFGVGEALYVA